MKTKGEYTVNNKIKDENGIDLTTMNGKTKDDGDLKDKRKKY